MNSNQLQKKFQLPDRRNWARLPTPIHKLEHLSEELGVEIFVKRDDLTGFQLSGNKIRKLNYLVHEALAQGATTLVTWGGVQSNHCRATAAMAAMLGLDCVLVLRGEKPKTLSANHLLMNLYKSTTIFVDQEQYDRKLETRAFIESQVNERGGKAYFIPEGGDCPLGAMGYFEAWVEINQQLAQSDSFLSTEIPDRFDSIITGVGTGSTLAGMILAKLCDQENTLASARIIGVPVCYTREQSFQRIKDTLWQTIQKFQLPLSFMAEDIQLLDGFRGLGYAISDESERKLIVEVAQQAGVLLDPVYTGKAFNGMVSTIKKDKNYFGKKVLFLHTGGGFGLFSDELSWDGVL